MKGKLISLFLISPLGLDECCLSRTTAVAFPTSAPLPLLEKDPLQPTKTRVVFIQFIGAQPMVHFGEGAKVECESGFAGGCGAAQLGAIARSSKPSPSAEGKGGLEPFLGSLACCLHISFPVFCWLVSFPFSSPDLCFTGGF